MTMNRKSFLSGLLALGLTLSVSARAQDAAAFYKGKTVHFVVGLGVGGGFDAYARMIAPYLGQELGANVVVDNLPGAGGLLALNQIYTGQADGLRLLGSDGKVIERSLIEERAPATSTEPEQAVAAMNEAFAMAMEALLNWCKGALPAK